MQYNEIQADIDVWSRSPAPVGILPEIMEREDNVRFSILDQDIHCEG
jgi:hypothetical protein